MEMQRYDPVIDPKTLKKFRRRAFRDSYMSGRVRTSIALQIRELRERLGLNQTQYAKKIGKPQSVISRLENTAYGRVTVQTLLDISRAVDVSLVAKFVPFDEFLRQHSDVSPSALAVESYDETISRLENNPHTTKFLRVDVSGLPDIHALANERLCVLWVLCAARKDPSLTLLTPAQISDILRDCCEIAISRQRVSAILAKETGTVARIRINGKQHFKIMKRR